MSKRMTDTGKWEKKWFREMPSAYKLFWQFILDRCDLAGFWDIDFKAASFFIGTNIKHDIALNYLRDQVYEVNGKYWLILDFIKFQNGWPLNKLSPVHKKIIELLDLKGIEIKDNTLYDRVSDRVCYTQQVIVKVIEGVQGEQISIIKELGWDKDEPLYYGLIKNYPKLFKMKYPLQYSEHIKLVTKFQTDKVKAKYESMQNRSDLLKKYDSAYLTANTWLNGDLKK